LLSTVEFPADPPGTLPPPATIGRFEITGVLGRGGMGIVLAGRDPALDRAVAIKLIPERFGPGDSAARTRFEREARGMAKLSHPNVVAVYEVGEVDDHPFIAMELVAGQTLRAWQAPPPKPWRVVLPIYVAAARGLAAAHDAGLVHRDFKPDNVLLGADLRPRVSDFGLVSGEGVAGGAARPDGTRPTVTRDDRWIGTPPYMPREQWLGEAVGPAVDQFAFCVSLWEAIFGQRPFAGDTASELCAAICDGKRQPPPDGIAVSTALVRVLERGLSVEAADRWPSMHAVIAELERCLRAPRRAVIAGGVGGGAIAAVVAVVALRGQPPEDPCPPPVERTATLWGTLGRDGVLAKLRATDPANGDERAAVVARTLDAFGARWEAGQVEACRAGGAAPNSLALQRAACLDDRLAFATGVVERLAAATTGPALDTLLPALGNLPSPASCADAHTLASFAMPPDPAARSEAAALNDEARAIELDRLAGKMVGLDTRGTALLSRARALDHAPTLTRALQAVSHVASDRNDTTTTATLLRELTAVAARAPDDDAASFAWCNLIKITAFDHGKPAEALAMLPAAEAAVLRAGDPVDRRVLYLETVSNVYQEVDRLPEALAVLDDARRRLTAAGADAVTSPLHDLVGEIETTRGHALLRAGQYEKAIEAFTAGKRATEEAYGVGHPLIAYTYLNIGVCYRNLGRLDDAIAANAKAVEIRRARLGPSPGLAWALSAHADSVRQRGRAKDVVDEAEEAYAMSRKLMAADDPELITVTLGAAVVFEDAGNLARARDMYDAVIELGQRSGVRSVNIPITLLNRGNLARKKGDCRAALPDYERALALFTEYRGAADYYNIYALRAVGHCELILGRPADALRHLDTALAIKSPPPRVASELLAVHFLHGTALVRTQRPGGRQEIAKARADADPDEVRELDGLLPDD